MLLIAIMGCCSDASFAQMKRFQKFYLGANMSFSYIPMTDFINGLNSDLLTVKQNTGIPFSSFNDHPFSNTFSLDGYYRDDRDLGVRVFVEYFNRMNETSTIDNDQKVGFHYEVSNFDLGVQVLWFLTEDYEGPLVMLGFGGSFSYPVVAETRLNRTNKVTGEYSNFAGSAIVSIIGMMPIYEQFLLNWDFSYRFNRSSSFSGTQTATNYNTGNKVSVDRLFPHDISFTGYLFKFGILYQLN